MESAERTFESGPSAPTRRSPAIRSPPSSMAQPPEASAPNAEATAPCVTWTFSSVSTCSSSAPASASTTASALPGRAVNARRLPLVAEISGGARRYAAAASRPPRRELAATGRGSQGSGVHANFEILRTLRGSRRASTRALERSEAAASARAPDRTGDHHAGTRHAGAGDLARDARRQAGRDRARQRRPRPQWEAGTSAKAATRKPEGHAARSIPRRGTR